MPGGESQPVQCKLHVNPIVTGVHFESSPSLVSFPAMGLKTVMFPNAQLRQKNAQLAAFERGEGRGNFADMESSEMIDLRAERDALQV